MQNIERRVHLRDQLFKPVSVGRDRERVDTAPSNLGKRSSPRLEGRARRSARNDPPAISKEFKKRW